MRYQCEKCKCVFDKTGNFVPNMGIQLAYMEDFIPAFDLLMTNQEVLIGFVYDLFMAFFFGMIAVFTFKKKN